MAREPDFALISGREVAYSGRFRLDFSELAVSLQAIPVAGLTYGPDTDHIVVTNVETTEEGVQVRVRHRRAHSIFTPVVNPAPRLFLVNRAAAEAIEGTWTLDYNAPQLLGAAPFRHPESSGFSVGDAIAWFPSAADASTPDAVDWRREVGWFNQAELVVVETRRAGSVQRTVEIPRLNIAAPSPK